jgi:hypothetical protein
LNVGVNKTAERKTLLQQSHRWKDKIQKNISRNNKRIETRTSRIFSEHVLKLLNINMFKIFIPVRGKST